jgi:hypothetical protein
VAVDLGVDNVNGVGTFTTDGVAVGVPLSPGETVKLIVGVGAAVVAHAQRHDNASETIRPSRFILDSHPKKEAPLPGQLFPVPWGLIFKYSMFLDVDKTSRRREFREAIHLAIRPWNIE